MQKTIFRIEVIVAVAAKAPLRKQHIVQGSERTINIRRRAAALSDGHGKFVDLAEARHDVEIGIIWQRDRQGRATEVDDIFRSVDGLTKFAVGVRCQCAPVA